MPPLSKNEAKVLSLKKQGRTYREIKEKLNLASVDSVKQAFHKAQKKEQIESTGKPVDKPLTEKEARAAQIYRDGGGLKEVKEQLGLRTLRSAKDTLFRARLKGCTDLYRNLPRERVGVSHPANPANPGGDARLMQLSEVHGGGAQLSEEPARHPAGDPGAGPSRPRDAAAARQAQDRRPDFTAIETALDEFLQPDDSNPTREALPGAAAARQAQDRRPDFTAIATTLDEFLQPDDSDPTREALPDETRGARGFPRR